MEVWWQEWGALTLVQHACRRNTAHVYPSRVSLMVKQQSLRVYHPSLDSIVLKWWRLASKPNLICPPKPTIFPPPHGAIKIKVRIRHPFLSFKNKTKRNKTCFGRNKSTAAEALKKCIFVTGSLNECLHLPT